MSDIDEILELINDLQKNIITINHELIQLKERVIELEKKGYTDE